MKRIMVIGVSAGVGKSTFARKLGEAIGVDVHHLDRLYWKPGWIEAPVEEFAAAQREIIKQDRWIMEGNYSTTFELREKAADTVIYLELPLAVCLYRVVTRWLKNIGKTRPDMGVDCPEKLDWPFIKFIITTYYSRKKKMRDKFLAWENEEPSKQVILLKNKKAVQSFLQELNSGSSFPK